MQITNFRELYIAELQELADVEEQLADVLRRATEAASHPDLKGSLLHHHGETLAQKRRLQSILQRHRADPGAHTDQAMQALIGETEKMLDMLKGKELRDAGLIASLQRLEHYEIAAYGTACALAGQLGLRDEQRLLHESLDEEKKADAKLTELAKRSVNAQARAA